MAQLKFLKRIGYSDINTLADDDSAFFYQAGMAIDADGGYHAYHPDGKSGLDYLANAGKPGNWWGVATDARGNPFIQKADDPAEGFYVSTTTLEDKSKEESDPRRYVNSEATNFFVLPGNIGLGSKVGDFGVVVRPEINDYDYAIYADKGPAGQIGEASIALAAALGVPSNPKKGGTTHGIIYLVFAGSQQQPAWPLGQADIDHQASALFAKWGGLDKVKECFPDAPWAPGPEIRIATPGYS